jgi:hypothetical protein
VFAQEEPPFRFVSTDALCRSATLTPPSPYEGEGLRATELQRQHQAAATRDRDAGVGVFGEVETKLQRRRTRLRPTRDRDAGVEMFDEVDLPALIAPRDEPRFRVRALAT